MCMMLALRGAVGVGVGACFLFSNSSRGGLRRHAGAPDDRNSHIKSDDRWLAAEPTFQLQGVSHARRHRVIPGEKMELPPPPLPPPRPDIIEMRWFIVLDYGHPTAPLPHSERTLERTLERTQIRLQQQDVPWRGKITTFRPAVTASNKTDGSAHQEKRRRLHSKKQKKRLHVTVPQETTGRLLSAGSTE